jgi:hypothetical protein
LPDRIHSGILKGLLTCAHPNLLTILQWGICDIPGR